MAGRLGTMSRSVISTAARSSSFLRASVPSATRRTRPHSSSSALPRPSISPSRNFAELGCVQSLLPFGNAMAMPRLTSHLSLDVRAFSELSNGRNGKDK